MFQKAAGGLLIILGIAGTILLDIMMTREKKQHAENRAASHFHASLGIGDIMKGCIPGYPNQDLVKLFS